MNAPEPPALVYPFATPPEVGAAPQVVPGVHWLRMPLPFALDHVNLWLLRDGDAFTVVDTGYGDDAVRAAWEQHFRDTLQQRPVTRIVVTHYHPDHVGNAAWMGERFGLSPTMTLTEFLAAHAVHDDAAGSGVADYCAHFRAHGMSDEDVAALAARGNRYARGAPQLPRRYHRILGGDTVRIGARTFRVIPGYGHSPEHAALFSDDGAPLLISGDMLLPRISTNVSAGPADAEGDPLARFLDSLSAYEALPPDTLVLPSHGLPFRGAAVRVAQLRSHHADRLAELHAAIAARTTPACAAELLPVLFRRPLDLQQRFFAMGEAIAHLNHLWHQGRLMRTVQDGLVRFAA
jgi:glyoxylase-like metal-dependent hydrolase (beta-lactamase superfamily II)